MCLCVCVDLRQAVCVIVTADKCNSCPQIGFTKDDHIRVLKLSSKTWLLGISGGEGVNM